MTISPRVTLGGGVTVTPTNVLSTGTHTIALPALTYEFSGAEIAYSVKLEFTSVLTQFILDINQGLITTPASGSSRLPSVGGNGRDADGETIDLDTLYYLGFRTPSTNGEKIDISAAAQWTDGPTAFEAASGDRDLCDLAAGSELHLVNAAGWAVASGDEIQFDSQGVGDATLELIAIGATT